MTEIARCTNLTKTVIADYPLTVADLHAAEPLVGWPGNPSDAAFENRPYVLVHPVAPPATSFGETAVKGAPEFVAGQWRQTWSVQSITLTEAKAQLADLAISIYWTKMQAVPAVAELTAVAGSYAQVLTDREARFKPKLLQVRTAIQAATTIAEAYALWLELRDLA